MIDTESQKTMFFPLNITESLLEIYSKNGIQTKWTKLCVHRFAQQCKFKGQKYNEKIK